MTEIDHPQRILHLEMSQNVRDLGGYMTADGTLTRWGRYVRAGDMDRLSEADQHKLLGYGIGTVIDLRMKREVQDAPNVFSGSDQVHFVIHDFWGDRFDDYRSWRKGAAPEQKLADLYCAGLVESGFVMADIMHTLADSEGAVIFHCRSGKDRTGLVAALLLSVADVPRETICADYALTASQLISAEADTQLDPHQPGYYLRGCAPETMALTLEFLDKEFGGPVSYLKAQGVNDKCLNMIRDHLRGNDGAA